MVTNAGNPVNIQIYGAIKQELSLLYEMHYSQA